MQHSCLYEGDVYHARRTPKPHRFRYRVSMLYLDLAELSTVFKNRWCWSVGRPNIASFRRTDHVGDKDCSLDETIRSLVEEKTGTRPAGPIRLLTHLRYFGYCFNPISIYYCFDRDERLRHVVLEVSNTPWKEMHCYIWSCQDVDAAHGDQHEFSKAFHVSPFMPMQMTYQCRYKNPGDKLAFNLENFQDRESIFVASMNLKRKPIGGLTLAGSLSRHPFATLRIAWLIHWNALCLWLKGVPIHRHPKHLTTTDQHTS